VNGTLLAGVRLDRGGPAADLLAADPERPFLRWRGGEWTVGEFARRARRCAAQLRARGVRRGDRVAIMSRNSAHQLAWQYGVYFLGAVEVPDNADLRGPMLDHVLDDCDPALIIAQDEFREALAGRTVHALDVVTHEELEPEHVAPEELATILYTSGTTGPSKGVMLPHGSFSNLGAVLAGVLELRPEDVGYFVMPFFHVDAHIVAPACLQTGSVLSFVERFSVRRFWSDVHDFGATWWFVIGSILEAVRSAGRPASPGRLSRAVGAPIPEAAYRFFEDELGIRIQSMYGQTEADAPCYETASRRKRGSAGFPCAGFDVAIVDEHGTELPAGSVGEIVYRPRHANLMTLGYWRREPEAGEWFHSGDLGTFDEDGFLFFRGRMTDSLRRRGENVSAYELEGTLRGAPGIADCAAIGVRDALGGEDEIKVFVTLQRGAELDAAAFFGFCERNLPRFAVPRYVEVVEDAMLVRSAGTGVVQKHRLPREHGPRMLDRLA
jgi:crotonobetaine/carnitine-CoA ligase